MDILNALMKANPKWRVAVYARDLAAGTVTFASDRPAQQLVFIQSGLASLWYDADTEGSVVATYGSGDVVQARSVLVGTPQPFHLDCEVPVRGFATTAEQAREIVARCEGSRAIFDAYAACQEAVHLLRFAFIMQNGMDRVLALQLLLLSDNLRSLQLPLTHGRIAQMIGGVRRPSVTVSFNNLKVMGLVEQTQRGLIDILALEKLVAFVGPTHAAIRAQQSAFQTRIKEILV